MAYCTYTEIQNLTGSVLSQTILEAIIAEADREIDGRLALFNLTGSGGLIKSASIHLSIAGLFTRYRLDGTKPGSLNIGGLSMSDNIDQAIEYHTKRGNDLISQFIAETSRRRYRIRKVNGVY